MWYILVIAFGCVAYLLLVALLAREYKDKKWMNLQEIHPYI